MTIFDHVNRAAGALGAAGLPARWAARDAELLARHVLGWDQAHYLAHRSDAGPSDFETRYQALVDRRARREPPAYIVGTREFWGLDFEVTPDVLIPRPESELIVEEALAIAAGDPPALVVDVGTGSGCLAISLAHELPSARVVATDVSAPALVVARRNAERHGVAARIRFVCADLLDGLALAADLIVANPPYVASRFAQGLQPEVRDYEPAVALFGGTDGPETLARFTGQAWRCLRPGGRFVCEFGLGQEDEMRSYFTRGWTIERVRADLQGIARTVIARREEDAPR
jgi:release factor glutamine methyltransferase